jgi:glutaconate CoA-transferase subunit B
MIEHSPHRLPERVSYITSPGNGDGAGYRKRVGLPRGGPSAIITTKAVLRFRNDSEAYLHSHHPGVAIEDVIASTGWKLCVSDNVSETLPPTVEELQAIREYDKAAFWTS